MNEWKPAMRLVAMVQIYLLFLSIVMPVLVRTMTQSQGKWVYGFLTVLSIIQAVLLRRLLAQLE